MTQRSDKAPQQLYTVTLSLQIYYYADSIYASAGVKQNDIQYVTVGTGAVNVFMTIAAVGSSLHRYADSRM